MRQRIDRRVLACVACAACGGPPAPPEPALVTARETTTCPYVADQMLSWMTTTARDAPQDKVDRMRRVFITRCEQDGWSAEARQCFLGATSMTEASERCGNKLTPDQTSAFGGAVQAEMEQDAAGAGSQGRP